MADVAEVPKVVASTATAKSEAHALLDRLPEDVTLEQIEYHLGVYSKITRVEERADKVGLVPQSEFDRRLEKSLTTSRCRTKPTRMSRRS